MVYDTNKNIRRYLGTYDDFILTAFSLQADNNNFIEKSQRERKDLLSQFLDITVFEQLYQLAADEIKETAGKLKEYKKTDFSSLINDSNSTIISNQQSIIELENKENELQEQRNELQDEIVRLIESKQPTTYTGPSINELIDTENKLIKLIDRLQKSIESEESVLDSLTKDQQNIKKEIKKFNELLLEQDVKQLEIYNKSKTDLNDKIKYTEGIIDAKQQKINHLTEHEYDPNCKYCTANIFVQDAEQAKNTITGDNRILTDLNSELDVLNEKIKTLNNSETRYKLLVDLKTKRDVKKIEIDRSELQIQVHENELQTRESELEVLLESKGKNTSKVWDQILADNGSVQNLSNDVLTEDEKEVFLTFPEVNQLALVQQAAVRQRYIDQTQSLNLSFHVDVVSYISI